MFDSINFPNGQRITRNERADKCNGPFYIGRELDSIEREENYTLAVDDCNSLASASVGNICRARKSERFEIKIEVG